MTEKYVLLKAKVMTKFSGQPYELEVRNASGLTIRVQPPDEDVVEPPVVSPLPIEEPQPRR